jgi:TonB family protein
MSSKPTNAVEAEVLGLPLEERARLAYRLLDSMDMDLERKTGGGPTAPQIAPAAVELPTGVTPDVGAAMWDERFAATVSAILQRITPASAGPAAEAPQAPAPAAAIALEPASIPAGSKTSPIAASSTSRIPDPEPSPFPQRATLPDRNTFPERSTFVDWEARLGLDGGSPEADAQPVIVGVGMTFVDWKRRRLVNQSLVGGAAAVVVLGLVLKNRPPAPSELSPLVASAEIPAQESTWKELPTVQPSAEPSRLASPVVADPAPERPRPTVASAPAPQRPQPALVSVPTAQRPRPAPAAAPRPPAPTIPAIPTLAVELIGNESVRPAQIDGPVILPTPPTTRTASASASTLALAPAQALRPPVSDVSPAARAAAAASNQPMASRFDVVPQVRDANRVRQALERAYPSSLRDWGISGQAEMWFFVNEQGAVDRFEIKKTSGNKLLDQAALKAAQAFEFTPGRLGDSPAAGWVSLPIVFNGM